MKITIWTSLTTIVFALFMGGFAFAQSGRQSTMTLLPAQESGKDSAGLLWIQNSPPQDIFLQFDLRALPEGLEETDFVRCTVRLIAQKVTYEPADNPNSGGDLVLVKGQMAKDDLTPLPKTPEIVSLSTLSNTESKKNSVALKATDDLTKAVYQQYTGNKKISLRFHTNSHKASSLFYSSVNTGTPANPSNIPRLVIEYTQRQPALLEAASWPQHQQNPEHTGRTPWIPFRAPTGFTLTKIPLPQINGNAGSIADYPLIYQGNIHLVSKVLDQNYLLSLDFKGKERWRRAIGEGIVQRSPVISRGGIFYVVTENKIAAYDLKQAGADFASYALTGKLSAFTDLTIGNDGSLFLALAENDLNYVYGFTPDLKPFLKAGPLGKGQEKISTLTASPDGRKIFAQTPAGAIAIDVTNPSEQETIKLANKQDMPWEYFHVPVAGPEGGVMIFSDFTSKANKGNIWGSTAAKIIWSTAGTLMPQPVLGSNGHVYYIEGGILSGHQYDQVGKADISSSAPELKTTSNLVMDGADNIYFWDNGDLHGYSPEAKPLFEKVDFSKTEAGLANQRTADPEALSAEVKAERNKDSSGPEQFIRLMVGPDGTLWANNQNGNMLFAFTPSYASGDLTLEQKDIKTQTVYRTQNDLRAGSLVVDAGTQLLFQAGNSIRLDKSFTVRKGASLLIRTDVRQAGL